MGVGIHGDPFGDVGERRFTVQSMRAATSASDGCDVVGEESRKTEQVASPPRPRLANMRPAGSAPYCGPEQNIAGRGQSLSPFLLSMLFSQAVVQPTLLLIIIVILLARRR